MNKIKKAAADPYVMPVKDLCRLVGKAWPELGPRLPLPSAEKIPESASLSPAEMELIVSAQGMKRAPKTIAFANLKGGVGKTTSAVTIATRAAQWGMKTCLIDLDAQASATLMLGIEPGEEDLLFCDLWEAPEQKVSPALKKIQEHFHIIPSALDNSLLDIHLSNPTSQKKAVAGVCKILREVGFELIIIDCPPALSTAVISTICAADTLVIPVTTDAFSRKGLELTIDEVRSICDTFGLQQIDLKILPNMIDRRLKLTDVALKNLRATHGELLLPGVIRTSSDFAKALEKKQSVFSSARKSNAKEDYDRVIVDLLNLSPVCKKLNQSK